MESRREFDGRDAETLAESIERIKRMKRVGLDLLNVSIGFSAMPWHSGFMTPIAARARRSRYSGGDGMGYGTNAETAAH
ncbi:hypothetical protein BG57_11375 [Caballeronia grimmiae]|uniref:Uncharacterized protein n=2 Tax=Caballeronia grimmiae TaxID=1071679 RepID=A0A069P8S2_9BURK|nr:hypothetical protein BG57_11375 [Caballeronia grimmiae]GGD76039.1 hypothetical protein GCM10010985_33230 [Caballeronia grimmiae]